MTKLNNPNLTTVSKCTQFKPGNTISRDSGVKPWTYRKNLQWVVRQELDQCILDAIDFKSNNFKAITKELMTRSRLKGNKINASRLIAIRMFERAITLVEPRMINKLINMTEGKLKSVKRLPPQRPDELLPENSKTLAEVTAVFRRLSSIY